MYPADSSPPFRRPRVSVGLPVFNGEAYLDEAISSVLEQSFEGLELIVSDNASTDRTPEICALWAQRDSRVRFHRNAQNLGATANYNAVAERARGEYFKWTAHDDTIEPEFIERCVRCLDARDDVVLAYTSVRDIDAEGNPLTVRRTGVDVDTADPVTRFSKLISLDYLCEAVFGVIRTEALRATGLLAAYADCDRVLLAHLGLLGAFAEVNEPLLRHRQHAERSVVRYPSRQSRGEWFSTGRGARPGFPYTREWLGFRRCVREARLSRRDRRRCHRHLARWGITYRRELFEDIDFAVRYLLRPLKHRLLGPPRGRNRDHVG